MASSDTAEFAIKTDSSGRFECPWQKWKSPGALKLLHWKFLQKSNNNIPRNTEILPNSHFYDTQELDAVLPVLSTDMERLTHPPIDEIQVTWIGHATLLVQFDGLTILTDPELDAVLPVLTTDMERLAHPSVDEIQVTWIGHATLLVQFDGLTILTDPVFRDYCGPEIAQKLHLSFQRYRKPPFLVKDIPNLDVVIITHDHFDHLDSKSVEEINERFPNVKWFIGTKGGELCKTTEENVAEMTWWEEKRIEVHGKPFLFACTPTQHWCRRSAFDMNKRLWCSWVIKGPTKSFLFIGDSGYYAPVFQKIGEVYGPFSLAGIPIGCYEPRSILEYQHVCPEEAAKIHQDVRAEYSVSMHWGTFKTMALEFYLDPPRRLDSCMGEDRDKFISIHHGETWVVGTHRERSKYLLEESTSEHDRNIVEKEAGDS